ncbi:MAG: DUF3488 domain-containing protein [Verrucomicrobia bacterium]|nr:MAG: DUF3488 domain-containing protein [Verrucomicrobiota bacterium]
MCAVKRRPQLNLEELLYVRWILGGILALLSVWTVFYVDPAHWPLAILSSVSIATAIINPRIPGRVPRWVWRAGVPLIAVVFAVDLMVNDLIPAFIRLNTMLVTWRAVSYRSRREDLQLAMLCLFLIVITGVLTVSLAFAVQILLFTGVGMIFLFLVNIIHDAGDGALPAPAQWTLLSRRRFARRLWQVFDLRVIGLTVALFVAVIGISVVIFLAIPRYDTEAGLGMFKFSTERSVTGFSENIALGEVTDIQQDNSVAMRVDVGEVDAIDGVPYWRMVVLDEYGSGMFRVSKAVTAHVGARSYPYVEILPDKAEAARPREAAHPEPWIVYMEGGISRYLPLPSGFTSVKLKEFYDLVPNSIFRIYSLEKPSATLLSLKIEGVDFSGVIPDPGFPALDLPAPQTLVTAGDPEVENRFPYRFLSYPATTRAVPVSREERAWLAEVVREIVGDRKVTDAREFAVLACRYLESHHRYSRQVSLPEGDPGADPVVRWLRSDSPGHCEFFAAAFTLLARTAGFPTRAVTGFKGGTWNPYEGYFMVRQSDAHAWCEIFDGKGAWLRVDPTPGAEGVPGEPVPVPVAAFTADDSFSAYLDSLRMLWYRRIVSFDERSQNLIAESFRNFGKAVWIWISAAGATVRDGVVAWVNSPWTLESKGDLLYIAIVTLVVAILMRRLGIGTSDVLRWFRHGERPVRERAGELILALEARMLRRRKPRRWDEATAERILRELIVIRYGRPESWPDPWRVFRAARRLL